MDTLRTKLLLLGIVFLSAISAFAVNKNIAVTFVDYEQCQYTVYGHIALRNNIDEKINKISFRLIYFDIKGNQIDYKTFDKKVSLEPRLVKKINVSPYGIVGDRYYYKDEGLPEIGKPFKLKFELLSYETDNGRHVIKKTTAQVPEVLGTAFFNEDGFLSESFASIPLLFRLLILYVLIFSYIGFTVVVGSMARRRYRNASLWIVLSLALTPVVPMILLGILGKKPLRVRTPSYGSDNERISGEKKDRWQR